MISTLFVDSHMNFFQEGIFVLELAMWNNSPDSRIYGKRHVRSYILSGEKIKCLILAYSSGVMKSNPAAPLKLRELIRLSRT